MDDSDGLGDEITIDPLPAPNIPIPRTLAAIARRVSRAWLSSSGRRPTWQGWVALAAVVAVVIGALKLAGVIWTSAPPKWVAALGPGVTVTGPAQVAPGYGSPGATIVGLLAALSSKDPGAACQYAFVPVARCEAQFSRVQRDQLPYGMSFEIGYVAIDGTRALLGFTGKMCSPGQTPECTTNTDPAAVFSTGNTFPALWAQTVNSNSPGAYTLLPCVEVGGKWYLGHAATRSDS